jgi:hypothetical protein
MLIIGSAPDKATGRRYPIVSSRAFRVEGPPGVRDRAWGEGSAAVDRRDRDQEQRVFLAVQAVAMILLAVLFVVLQKAFTGINPAKRFDIVSDGGTFPAFNGFRRLP